MAAYLEDLRQAMKSTGLDYLGEIVADGKLHRFNCEGEKGEASWLVAHSSENFLAAAFGCWRRNINETWNSSKCNGLNLSREEWAELKRKMESAQSERRTAEEQLRSAAKLRASILLSAASQSIPAHDYLDRKRVKVHGKMRLAEDGKESGCLVLPLYDSEGLIWSVQLIAPDKRFSNNRDKDFIFGGKVNGCFYTVSDRADGPLVICEGYATGASIFEATGYATICAMFCGNLLAVAKAMRAKFPDRTIVIAADNDSSTTGNPGETKAKAAADAIKGKFILPTFSDLDSASSDFNDLAHISGLPAVKAAIDTVAVSRIDSLIIERIFDFRCVPAQTLSVYELMGRTICTPGNLSAITAHIKAGKTAAIGAMVASTMAQGQNFDTFGFSSRNDKGLALVHFDTEQSPEDFWHCNNRVLKRAQLSEPPSWFLSYRLKGLNLAERKLFMFECLKRASDACGGIHSIILDGLADFVSSVNDEQECNDFISELDRLTVDYRCPLAGMIHFNPGSEGKTRGHLGSQFERKAESNLRLDKVEAGVTTIWSDKQRGAPIPKNDGPCFVWSDEAKMHVSTNTRGSSKDQEKAENYRLIAEAVFQDRPSMSWSDLKTTLEKVRRVASKTAEEDIRQMVRLNVVKKEIANRYVIAS